MSDLLPPAVMRFVAETASASKNILNLTATVDKSAASMDKADVSARKMALSVENAAVRATRAQERATAATQAASKANAEAAAAAEKAAKGLISEADAAKVAADAAAANAKAQKLTADAQRSATASQIRQDEKTVVANDKVKASQERLNRSAGLMAVAFGAAAYESVKSAMHFQAEMTRLHTAAGAAEKDVRAANNRVIEIANSTAQTGTAIAEALYHPISAGYKMADALNIVKEAAKEAAVSGSDLKDTSYALSSVMMAFNQPGKNATKVMSQLNAIVHEGDMRFQDFNLSVKNWAPTAAAMGISIQSMGSALAYLTDRGMKADEASTRLTMGLSMAVLPSKKATDMLIAMGMAQDTAKAKTQAMKNAMEAANITTSRFAEDLKKPDGVEVALRDMKDHLEKVGISGSQADRIMGKIFGGGRSDKAIMSLMQNLDGLSQKYKKVGEASRSYGDSWAKTQQTAQFQFNKVKAQVENLGITIGAALLPTVSKALNAINGLFKYFHQHEGQAHALGEALRIAGIALLTYWGVAKIGAIASKMWGFTASLRGAAAGAKETTTALSGMQKANIIITAFVALSQVTNSLDKSLNGTTINANKLTASLTTLGRNGYFSGNLLKQFHQSSANTAEDVAQFRQQMQELTSTGLGNKLDRFYGKLNSLIGQTNQYKRWADNFKQIDRALAAMVQGGHAGDAQAAFNEISAQAKRAGVSIAKLKTLFPQYSSAVNKAKNANVHLKLSQDDLNGAFNNSVGKLINADDALQNYRQSLRDTDAALKKSKGSVDAHTAAGKAARDALKEEIRVGQAYITNLLGQTNGNKKAVTELIKQRNQIQKQAGDTAFGRKVIKAYNQEIAKVKAKIKQTWNVSGKASVYLPKSAQAAMKSVLPSIGLSPQAMKNFGIGRAAGGPVSGPGTTTSDSIHTRLSRDEHVWTAREVSAAGGHGAVMQIRQMAKAGAFKQPVVKRAEGGPVAPGGTWKSNFTRFNANVIENAAKMNAAVAGSLAINMQKAWATVMSVLGGGSGKGALALKYAESQLGVPYVWGGTAWGKGMDCSGLTMMSYRKAGVTIPRTSQQQYGFTKHIKQSEALPGDLVFWEGVPPGHVGMYVSPGKAINEPHTGASTRYRSLAGAIAFGRVPGASGTPGGFGNNAKAYAHSILAQEGESRYYGDLVKLWQKESSWNPNAVNKSSGAYGIPQALGHGHPYALGDWRAQVSWGLNYIAQQYGNPGKAWAHEERFNWYQKGTKGAKRGWAWTGESGPELVKFNGGETVLNHQDSMASAIRTAFGYASGTMNAGYHITDYRRAGIDKSDIYRIGKSVIADLKKVMSDSASTIKSGMNEIISHIKQAFIGKRESSLLKWVEKSSKTLQSYANKVNALDKKISAANSYRSDLMSSMSDYGSLSGFEDTTSATGVHLGMINSYQTLSKLTTALKSLQKAGYNRTIIGQVAAMSPDQALQYANVLLGASKTQISQMNWDTGQIAKFKGTVADTATNIMYDSGKQAGKGLLSGLKAQRKALDSEMDRLAKRFGNSVRQVFGHTAYVSASGGSIKRHATGSWNVPERSVTDPGELVIPQPWASIVRSQAQSGGNTATLPTEITVPVVVNVDGKQVYAAVQKQSLRKNFRNPTNRLGR